MITESKVNESLTTLIHEVGIPYEFYSDNVNALIQGDYCKKVKNMRYILPKLNLTHPGKTMEKGEKNSEETWSLFYTIHRYTYCFVAPIAYSFAAAIRSRIGSNKQGMQGRKIFENTYGYTLDISEYT